MRTILLTLALLILPSPSPIVAADSLFRASMVAAVAAHGADLATTEHCLGSGRCKEMNNFLARFDRPLTFGAVKMGLAAGQLWLVAHFQPTHPKLAIVTNILTTVTFSYIAVHNARVGQGQ